jgi:hypothetical protein
MQMPNAVIKKYAKEAGVSEERAEREWDKAREKADKKFKTKDEQYWGYVHVTTRFALGIEQKRRAAEKKKKEEEKKKKKTTKK